MVFTPGSTDQSSPLASGMLPGEALRRAREQQQLSLEQVADKLNLLPGKVRALESDDYAALPGATFIKGYIRSYARLLKIPSEDLIASYEQASGCNQPQKVAPVQAPLTRPKAVLKVRFIVAFGVAILVAALYWLWP